MATRTIGIILNGATGRICSTQHLQNALVPIRDEGGLIVGDDRVVPRPVLVGRGADRLAEIAAAHGIADWTTDLDAVLADPAFSVMFDAGVTGHRGAVLGRAIAAGKHIYSEKPVAASVAEGLALLRAAEARGLKHGAVEDKLYLPGLQELARLARGGFFGRIIGFRLEFGWWVFDGVDEPCQRPSWNYQRAGGGGLILDMYPHWRYVLEGVVGRIGRVVSAASTATPVRVDERGQRYAVDVEDTSVTLIELESGACGTVLSSWATRVRRDDLFTFQVDGSKASAVAGLHRCWTQTNAQIPGTSHVNVATDIGADYRAAWDEVVRPGPHRNPYRIGWESFLRHLVAGSPIEADLAAGVRDIALAEACYRSMAEDKWVALDDVVQPSVRA
ncbi:MAG: Gfo/Idh/MocA family oxidoreductase [Hyphomonadaceae bacterium]|jgi:predicted dehydrogenase|nr:Gfo/Idh/MocA family oxidoreductase [Hyphomonadaceae bacterium]